MNEKDEARYALQKFQKALSQLKNAAGRVADDLDQDGVIKRFEFTFEAFWKFLKSVADLKGKDVMSPRDSILAAFEIGVLKGEETFLAMLRDRNLTAHIYDHEMVREIYGRIQTQYLGALEQFLIEFNPKQILK